MPFIAEELWHQIRERKAGEDIIIAAWPEVVKTDASILKGFELAQETITHIRNVRKQNNIANKVKMDLFLKKNTEYNDEFEPVIVKLGNLSQFENTADKIANANSFIVQGNEYFIPFGDSIDIAAERKKLEEELEYAKGFLNSVNKKLENEKFVSGAPEQVIANERKKAADASQKITLLEEKLASLV